MTEEPRVLLVDDEPNLLAGLRRQLGRRYNLTTRESGAEALAALREGGRYAVIVADMRMPGMDGAALLAEIARLSPLTVRIMLTGNADQETASRAVNEGQVFRFLNKPVEAERLAAALDAGIERWRAAEAEKELLEKTLAGVVKLLVDLLGASHPTSLGRIDAMRRVALPLADRLCPQLHWAINLTCLLADIGLLFTPLERRSADDALAAPETTQAAAELLRRIPRLDVVGGLLAAMTMADGPADNLSDRQMAAAILRFALTAAQAHPGGTAPLGPAINLALQTTPALPEDLRLAAQQEFADARAALRLQWRSLEVGLERLHAGDVTVSEIRTADGVLLLAAGVTLTDALIARLRLTHRARPLAEPFAVKRAVTPE